MKIQNFKISKLRFPLKKPFSTVSRQVTHIDALYLQLFANLTHGTAFIYHDVSSHDDIIKFIESLVYNHLQNIQLDHIAEWKIIWQTLRQNTNSAFNSALALLDIALWDAFSKKANQPLYQFISNKKQTQNVPLYATTGWLSFNENELLDEINYYQKMGINAFKLRLGHKDDIARVNTIRAAVGQEFHLMLDANQQFNFSQIQKLSASLQPYKITWLEEPLSDLNDYPNLQNITNIPLALGENFTDVYQFKNAINKQYATIYQPDIVKCGGITGFIACAELIDKYALHLCNHLYPLLSMSLLANYKTSYWLEYDEILPTHIYKNAFNIKNGHLHLPEIAGSGLELSEESLKEYQFKHE